MNVRQLVRRFEKQLVAIRRDLHRIPELAFKEEKTSVYVADQLRETKMDVITGIAGTGVMGILSTGRPGPTLLIRADMDALPITEKTGLSFCSEHPGAMHSCGHDGHMAMALAAAMIMAQVKNEICGTIKFVFQPAEEGPGGAAPMIRAGVLEDPPVDYALGCHIWPDIPEGTIGIRAGALMAAMFSFDITITGKGGHGAMPHLCVDALETGCQVVGALQRIVSRKMNPFSPTAITIGRFEAGTAFNVIPERARLWGTARTFEKTTWQNWPTIIETVVKGVCDSMGAGYEIRFEDGYPPLVNDEDMAELMRRIATDVVGTDRILNPERSLGGEDMAFFLEKTKGCFFCLGAGNASFGAIHNPRFDFDETILTTGVELYCQTAMALLGRNSSRTERTE